MRLSDLMSVRGDEALRAVSNRNPTDRSTFADLLPPEAMLWISITLRDQTLAQGIFGHDDGGSFTILEIDVDPAWRRQGIATTMAQAAVGAFGLPLQTPDIVSDQGQGFWNWLVTNRPDLAVATMVGEQTRPVRLLEARGR